MYLKPFNRACLDSLSIMTAYSSYDGIPAIAGKRESPLEDTFGPILTLPYSDLLTDIVRAFISAFRDIALNYSNSFVTNGVTSTWLPRMLAQLTCSLRLTEPVLTGSVPLVPQSKTIASRWVVVLTPT